MAVLNQGLGRSRVQIVRWRADAAALCHAAGRIPRGPFAKLRAAEIAASAVLAWVYSDPESTLGVEWAPAVEILERPTVGKAVPERTLPMLPLRLSVPCEAWADYQAKCRTLSPVIASGKKVDRRAVDPYTLTGIVWRYVLLGSRIETGLDRIPADFSEADALRYLHRGSLRD